MSKAAREVMRKVKNSVDDAGGDLNLRLAQLTDRINEHLDSVVKKVRDTDNFDSIDTTRGRNSKTTHFDPENRRPVQENGTILDDFGSSDRGDNATAIGQLGRDGDDGGHLGGHRFYGDTPDEGIVPQAANLNRGAWKKMENEWADWAAEGCRVDYRIAIDPPGAVRPDRFQVAYVVSDPSTGEILETRSPSFDNITGEIFHRINQR
ncbi:DNA/RNA non-specific endonuclease [Microbacterium sp. YMB-B2]|uniref:DNA/RNA non-specific endonuclease n=1 Tax=Microbacterium tenebrionis TaxID=2830665 RepID=A0A9X1LN50_9MICO|nr:DNA/RNA non-specific endonuclease [Microbacterium tenebrionis]MCC2028756.1 DNA/RNA non-specific endonuclease [Microbacterium tenebrionis]